MHTKHCLLRLAAAGLISAALVTTANATCVRALRAGAIWHLHAILVQTSVQPPIALRCILSFRANGNYTGSCVSYATGVTTGALGDVSGRLTLTGSCNFKGSMVVVGSPSLLFRFGHINGNFASGIGTIGPAGSASMVHFTMVRN